MFGIGLAVCLGTGISVAREVTLAWEPSPSPHVGGYEIYYGLSSGQYTTVLDVGNQTRYTVTDLQEESTYYFAVTAYDVTRTLESAFSNEVDTSGLVAAYGFEEAGGTIALDASERRNAAFISGALRTQEGRFGRGLAFDGANDRVVVNPAPSLDLTTGMTIEAWLYPTDAMTSRRAIIAKERPSRPLRPVYCLSAHADVNEPSSTVQAADGQRSEVLAGRPLETFQWTHLAATFDGQALRLYINGVEVASQQQSAWILRSSGPLILGGLTSAGQGFTGMIDEVRIYSRALTPQELWDDMNTPVAGEFFNGLEYIASYADLILAFRDNPTHEVGALHYLGYGRAEGRVTDAFNVRQYLTNYPDLQAAFGSDTDAATVHFIQAGFFEGRTDQAFAGD